MLILAPFLATVLLLRLYLVDTPFSDDWTFIEDWIKLKAGSLTLGQLFTAHMEHRVTVPRLLALSAHLIGGGDLRWQNAITMLVLMGTGWNLVQMLKTTTGSTVSALWLPLFLMSAMLFCAVQWQGFLWPILFEAYIPVFMLTIVLRVWLSALRPWFAFAISAVAALIGMWSFGNGPLTLVLVPVLFWTLRESLTRRERWQLSIAWSIFALAAVGLYSLNFTNAVPQQFSYGQGADTTVHHSVTVFLQKLPEAPQFIIAVLGSHLSRGLHVDNLFCAELVGGLSVGFFAAVLGLLWTERKDLAFIRALTPWLLLGLFSIGTAVFTAIGRMWVSRTAVVAISLRYVSHAVPLTIALIAAVSLIVLKKGQRITWVPQAVTLVAGALAMLLLTQWDYGIRNMELWQQSRLQGKALLMFAKVLPNHDALGPVGGDGGYTVRLALEMERLGIMHPPLLQDLGLKHFRVSEKNLTPKRAAFFDLKAKPNGQMTATGYSELTSGRPADLVLFTSQTGNEPETIFAIGTLEGVPRYLYFATKRDREYEATPQLTPEWTSRWAGPISLVKSPAADAKIRAWALDVERMEVHRIPDLRSTQR